MDEWLKPGLLMMKARIFKRYDGKLLKWEGHAGRKQGENLKQDEERKRYKEEDDGMEKKGTGTMWQKTLNQSPFGKTADGRLKERDGCRRRRLILCQEVTKQFFFALSRSANDGRDV